MGARTRSRPSKRFDDNHSNAWVQLALSCIRNNVRYACTPAWSLEIQFTIYISVGRQRSESHMCTPSVTQVRSSSDCGSFSTWYILHRASPLALGLGELLMSFTPSTCNSAVTSASLGVEDGSWRSDRDSPLLDSPRQHIPTTTKFQAFVIYGWNGGSSVISLSLTTSNIEWQIGNFGQGYSMERDRLMCQVHLVHWICVKGWPNDHDSRWMVLCGHI